MRAYGIHPTHRLRLLASNAVVMHNGLVFEVYGIFVHKKTAPFGLDGGCPTFGVQFKVQTALSFFTIKIQKNKPEKTRACLGHIPYMQATLAMTYILHTGYACYTQATLAHSSTQ